MTTDNIKLHLDHIDTPLIAEMSAILKNIGISFFMYYVNFSDGSEIKCTNRPDWTSYFIEQQLYRDSMLTLPPEQYQPGFYWMNDIENKSINQIRKTQFNIDNVLLWMNPVATGCEMIFFGTETHKSMLTFYFNHLRELRQYIIYFKNSLSPQLQALQATRLLIPNRLEDRQQRWQHDMTHTKLEQFQQQIKIKKFYLDGEYAGTQITARELEVLRELSAGSSYKIIAARLHISPRTVETHLSKLKEKLNCNSREALRAFFNSHFES